MYIKNRLSVIGDYKEKKKTLTNKEIEALYLMTPKKKENMYLDWLNNYLTLEHFANNNHISKALAEQVISEGKSENFC